MLGGRLGSLLVILLEVGEVGEVGLVAVETGVLLGILLLLHFFELFKVIHN
jgi:hypothetical protein